MSGQPIGHLDHIVLAAADLERACDVFEAATGVRPAFGGAHPGLGTHNALVAFDAGSYLEIIAPDPAQQAGAWADSFSRFDQLTPLHWAVRVSGLADVATRLRAFGWTPTAIRHNSRLPPNGRRLEWDMCGLTNHGCGGVVPFFLDWRESPHPAASAPRVGALISLELSVPQPAPLTTLLGTLAVAASVHQGALGLAFRFASPRGECRFAAAAPSGFGLPD